MISPALPVEPPSPVRELVHQGAVWTIGNFDGLHRGHRTILRSAVADAVRRGLPAVAMTFEPHPVEIFAEKPPEDFRLATSEERTRALVDAGLSGVWTVPFSRNFAAIAPLDFLDALLVRTLRARSLHVGYDFNFGHRRSGTTATLLNYAKRSHLEATVHPAVIDDGAPVSSTRIRSALRHGDVEQVNRLLGQPWSLSGPRTPGAGRGTGIGIPTINLYPQGRLLPPPGVYVTTLRVPSTGFHAGAVTNVGYRPTFDVDKALNVETMCLGPTAPDVQPGVEVDVRFLTRLREERHFPSTDALLEQVADDRARAAAYHARFSATA